jgi:hypothetical protein
MLSKKIRRLPVVDENGLPLGWARGPGRSAWGGAGAGQGPGWLSAVGQRPGRGSRAE